MVTSAVYGNRIHYILNYFDILMLPPDAGGDPKKSRLPLQRSNPLCEGFGIDGVKKSHIAGDDALAHEAL